MKRVITIEYDDEQPLDGEPLDLFAYLVNELNNAGIVANVTEGGDL